MANSHFEFTEEHEDFLEQYSADYDQARKMPKAQRLAATQQVAQSVTAEFVKEFELDGKISRRLRHVCTQNIT